MGIMTSAGLMFMLQTMLPTTGIIQGQKISHQVAGIEQKTVNNKCVFYFDNDEATYELSMILPSNKSSQIGLIFDEEELGEEPTFSAEILPTHAVKIKQDFSDSEVNVLFEKTTDQQFQVTFQTVGAGDSTSLKCQFKQ